MSGRQVCTRHGENAAPTADDLRAARLYSAYLRLTRPELVVKLADPAPSPARTEGGQA